MVDDFLRVREDGMVHRYRYYYGDCYEDAGLYKTKNGNFVALNGVTGELDVVRANHMLDVWERVEAFRPDGKEVGVRRDTGVVDETGFDFWRRTVKKADFVPPC